MSVDKATNPCNKFQANIFNKSKCQNCFKSRELHLLTDYEMEQARPVYGGWLCLAPEGTDFDNPTQRSRKWQRRFFILYENGNLSFALDELMSTLPQGTVDMNACTSVADAELRTGQRNALCIATPQQDIFIRGESRDMINGWCEQIAVFPRNNKHSCSRKHKVDHDPTQEACPAKIAATRSCPLEVEGAGDQPVEPGAGLRKDAQLAAGLSWTSTDMEPLGPVQSSSGDRLQCHPTTARGRSSSAGTEIKPAAWWRGTASVSPNRERPANHNSSPSQMHKAMGLDPGYPTATDIKQEGDQSESRMGRSDARANKREKMQSCGDVSHIPVPQRRAKSLDRRTSDSIMTPDLLNFKKGWMVKLEKEDQWRKYWFVLSADNLRYYKDSIAEEAFDLQGEIDLTKCYDVSEYQVLRNYGFQIQTQRGVYTLSAMTAGIRKNWIQALMKNVNPANATDVASFPGLHMPPEALPKPDVTRASPSKGPTEEALHLKDPPKTLQERRRDEGCKTSDWTEFRPLSESALEQEIRRSGEETVNQEKRRRRQQRRKRYESILGLARSHETTGDEGEGGREVGPRGGTSGSQQILVEEEDMEKIWIQVERTAFRVERAVPLFTETVSDNTVELQRLMETYRQGVEDLRSRLEESDCRRLELEAQLRTTGFPNQEICLTTGSTPSSETEGDRLGTCAAVPLHGHAQNLRDMYWETRGLLQQQNAIRQSMHEQLGVSLSPLEHEGSPRFQTPSIWLHDTDGNQQELGYFHPDFSSTLNTTAPSLVSYDEEPLLHYEGERGMSNIQTHLERAAYEQVLCSDAHINKTTWSGKDMGEDYEQTPNFFESLSGQDERVAPELAVFKRLTQEVALLTGQNKALHQHNQEMLNQLTEANREIERLKADFGHLPEMEQMSQTRVVFLETELNSRNQELLEAKSLIVSLEQRLIESLAPQLGTAALQALDIPEDTDESGVQIDDTMADCRSKGYLLRCFEATEAKLMDLERMLHQSEQSCSELQSCNMEMEEAARTCSRRIAEVEAEVARLSAELENEKSREGWKIPNEENFLQVSEGTETVSKAQGKLIEVIGRSDFRLVESEREEPESTLVSHCMWEDDEFWGTMLNRIKADSSRTAEDKLICVLLIEMAEHMLVERQLLLLAQDLLLETASCTSIERANLVEIDEGTYSNGTGNLASATPENENWSDFTGTMDLNNQHFCKVRRIGNDFTASIQQTMNYIACVNTSSTGDNLKLMGHRLSTYYLHRWLHTIHNAAADAWHCRLMDGKLSETQQRGQLTLSPTCTNCASLGKENRELRAIVSFLEKELETASAGSKTLITNPQSKDEELQTPSIWLHDTKADLRMLGDSNPEDPSTLHATTPSPVSDCQNQLLPNESQSRRSNHDGDGTTSTPTQGDREDTGAGNRGEEQVRDSSAVTKAEQELAIVDSKQTMERPKENGPSYQNSRESPHQEVGNVEMSNHGRDVDLDEEEEEEEEEEEIVRLRGRVKTLEEKLCLVVEKLKTEHDGIMSALQLQHEKDMERLKAVCEQGLASMEESQQRVLERIQLHHQGDLERLLTDRDQLLEEETAATVTAIESMKRAYQLQLDRQAEKTHWSKVSTDNTHLQETHRQHREELEVLAQQYSLQRLENSHLGQALEAERTALCQCQQENQALHTRNQELSGLLAAELSRLCSRSQQEASLLRQGADVYELEISLRVTESEIQCLRQEVISLKDELLHAHRDRSLAMQQQTEISTELNVVKVRFQRDVDILRENLRLAHRALEQTIP